MSSVEAPSCQHIKVNGEQCGCPALRGRRFCRFHDDATRRQRRSAKLINNPFNHHRPAPFKLPVLEDANAVQVALMETINGLLDGRINEQRAGLLFYALQTASANLKRTNFEPPIHLKKGSWSSLMLKELRAIREQSSAATQDATASLTAGGSCGDAPVPKEQNGGT